MSSSYATHIVVSSYMGIREGHRRPCPYLPVPLPLHLSRPLSQRHTFYALLRAALDHLNVTWPLRLMLIGGCGLAMRLVVAGQE